MSNIAPITNIYRSNLVEERIAEHRKKLGFFKKLRIELNDIGKRVQSFFSETTCGLVANPYSLSKLDARGAPRYAYAPTKEKAVQSAATFIHQKKLPLPRSVKRSWRRRPNATKAL